MNVALGVGSRKVACEKCPLQKSEQFRCFSKDEVAFLSDFKIGEMNAGVGATIMMESSHSAHLYSVLSGAAFRYKMLEDGRRQILNFIFPGDLIGLQGSVMGEMEHSVEVLSPILLCVFERTRLPEVYQKFPSLAFDLTWLAAREERILDENLLNIGRRSAYERAAYLLAYLFVRAKSTGLVEGRRLMVPITQLHLADTLGLSVVHTNRTLKRLAERKLIRWHDRTCEVLDLDRLLAIAQWHGELEKDRPYI